MRSFGLCRSPANPLAESNKRSGRTFEFTTQPQCLTAGLLSGCCGARYSRPLRGSHVLRSAAGDSIPVVNPDAVLQPPSRGSQYATFQKTGAFGGNNGGSGSSGDSNQPGAGSEGQGPGPFGLLLRALWVPLKSVLLFALWTLAVFTLVKCVWGVLGFFAQHLASALSFVMSALSPILGTNSASLTGDFQLPGGEVKDALGVNLVVGDGGRPLYTVAMVAKHLANAALIYVTMVGSLLFFVFYKPGP